MSSKKPMKNVTPKEAQVIDIASSALTYLPTPDQRRTKSAFWASYDADGTLDPTQISLATALRLASDNRLSKWWQDDGFKEWFRNRDEFKQRLENLAQLALDKLEYLLVDGATPAASAVAAAKLVLEAAKKMPKAAEAPVMIDKKINEMSRAELEKFIADKMKPQLPESTDPSKPE